MADEMTINVEFSEDRTVEITDDESSSKIAGLTKKMTDLEQENDKINLENSEYKRRIEELKYSFQELSTENVDVQKKVEKEELENKVLGAVAARAAELESEVSRLQHDLVSTNVELSDLKGNLDGTKEREKEKNVELTAVMEKKNLLVSKVEKLEGVERGLRDELEGKENKIRGLKNKIEELESDAESNKNLEKSNNELERIVKKWKRYISVQENCLEEKEHVISGFAKKERAFDEKDVVIEDGKKGLIGDSKRKEWAVVGGSTAAAVALIGVIYYVHASRKH